MFIKEVPNSPGIIVILPQVTPQSFEDWKRKKGWKMKRWNYYNESTRQYKNFQELLDLYKASL